MPIWRLPETDEHTAIVGRNGSGKTVLGWFVLSKAPFDRMPFYILDFKLDETINSVARVRQVGLTEKVTRHPGLYIVHAHPNDGEAIDRWFLRLWENGHTGLFVDEMYMAPGGTSSSMANSAGLDAILTQGRALRVPGIFLSQRPVGVPRAVFSESTHIVVFHLQDKRDRDTVRNWTPPGMMDKRLPKHHSYWYNVKDDDAEDEFNYSVLSPVPRAEIISQRIDDRLGELQQRKTFK